MMKLSSMDEAERILRIKLTNAFKEARKVINNDYPDVGVCTDYTATDKSIQGVRHLVISLSIYEEKE